MKKFFQSRWSAGLLGFFLGIFVLWSAQKVLSKIHFQAQFVTSNNESPRPMPEDAFGNDDEDPFQQMRRMQAQIMNHMQHEAFDEGGGAGAFQFSSPDQEASSGFKTREDDHYVYYDIELKGMNPSKFDVKVENGQVNISGKFDKKNENEDSAGFMSSSFQRSFPVPENTDADKFQIESKGDVITLKFPKRATT